ncbi:MAG: zf-HC2 domain-containing protein [Gemmatimonadota bacterium]
MSDRRVTHEDLMRYLDGEMPPEERRSVESALEGSTELAREVAIYRALHEDFLELSFQDVRHRSSVWERVNRRLTRPIGWGLLAAGTLIWIVYGAYVFLTGPADPWEKLATGAVVIGILVLLASVVYERYRESLTDPYRDVQR